MKTYDASVVVRHHVGLIRRNVTMTNERRAAHKHAHGCLLGSGRGRGGGCSDCSQRLGSNVTAADVVNSIIPNSSLQERLCYSEKHQVSTLFGSVKPPTPHPPPHPLSPRSARPSTYYNRFMKKDMEKIIKLSWS